MKNVFADCIGFDWDEGNSEKNWVLHQVSRNECEQVFFNAPVIVGDDLLHSQSDKRWFLLGKTHNQCRLFIVFTIRDRLIRIISARDMSKKEKRIYNEKSK
ncbi:MAG: BrnT family toxin [Bacteroidales bacterium]|nr:BrnT family toxin [Bacteroidales bacterium]MDT8432650.1 BrnT family toxin [Bacteroidales bacterium]